VDVARQVMSVTHFGFGAVAANSRSRMLAADSTPLRLIDRGRGRAEGFPAGFAADSQFVHGFGHRLPTGRLLAVTLLEFFRDLRDSVHRISFLLHTSHGFTNTLRPLRPSALPTLLRVVKNRETAKGHAFIVARGGRWSLCDCSAALTVRAAAPEKPSTATVAGSTESAPLKLSSTKRADQYLAPIQIDHWLIPVANDGWHLLTFAGNPQSLQSLQSLCGVRLVVQRRNHDLR
jgi:hypothetical protein